MCNCNKSSAASRIINKQQAAQSSAASSVASPRRKAARRRETPVAPVAEPLVEIEGETFDDKCRTFAYMLGLDEPVSREVLEAAIDYPAYARSLMGAKDNPERFSQLLYNPPIVGASKPLNNFTNARLIAKASTALFKWAASGFPTVSKAVLRQREDACLACPNLTEPSSVLQRATASAVVSDKVGQRTGNKSCSACGCVITNKIRLATESCPIEDPEIAGMNRWGEPLKSA